MSAVARPRHVSPTEARSKRVRGRLQTRISAWTDVPLAVLALLMFILIVTEYLFGLPGDWLQRVHDAETAIWIVFAFDFFLELALAPSKIKYLKHHWVSAIAVAVPPLRGVRILRAAYLLRGVSAIRVLTVIERGTRALDHIAKRGQLAYVVALTLVIAVAAAAGGYYFEHSAPGASIRTPEDAIWWAFTLVTTMNSSLEAVTVPGRVVGLILRLFALGVSGYLTAVIAAFLVRSSRLGGSGTDQQLGDIRKELADLRRLVSERHAADAQDGASEETPSARTGTPARSRVSGAR